MAIIFFLVESGGEDAVWCVRRDHLVWSHRLTSPAIDVNTPDGNVCHQLANAVTFGVFLWVIYFFFFYILSVFMVISRAPPSSCFLRAAGLCTAIAILVCSAGCFILLYSRVLRPSPINLALPLLASSFRSHLPSYIFFAWKVWSDQKSPTIIQLKATSHVLPVAFHAFFYNDSRYVE